jgi:hypothetical protein
MLQPATIPAGEYFGLDGTQGLNQYVTDPLNGLDISSFVDAAMAYMLPGIKPQLSIVNSIIELKDFKGLPRSIDRMMQFFHSLPSWLRTAKKQKATLREITKLSSEAYLTHQFALAPLLREVNALCGILSSVRLQLKKLEDNAARVQYAHYKQVLTPDVADGSTTHSHVEGGAGNFNYSRTVTNLEKPTLRASMKYTYQIHTPKEYRARTAFLDALGLNLNPQIIWNAIPWSFVVDWVFGVSRYLSNFNMANLDITTNIHQFCISYKLKRRVDCLTAYSTNTLLPASQRLTLRREDDVYSRRAFEPDLTRHLALSGLNLKEFSYVGALLGVRV